VSGCQISFINSVIGIYNINLPVEKVIIFSAPSVELVGKPVNPLKVVLSETVDTAEEMAIKEQPEEKQKDSEC